MNTTKKLLSLILILAIASCTPKMTSIAEKPVPVEQKKPFENTEYFIKSGNDLIPVELDVAPISRLGDRGFLEVVYRNIRYPAKARNKGISGTVKILIGIDESGTVISSALNEGIGYGCDEESLKVVNLACQHGFEPAMKDGEAKTVYFNIPVKFKIH